MKRQATAAVLGHGFPLKLRAMLMDNVKEDDSNKNMDLEVAFAHALQIHHNFRCISVQSTPYAASRDARLCLKELATPQTDILILHFGDNELSQHDCPPEVAVDQVISLARRA